MLGVDIIPAQPPKGVSTIQGNFLSSEVQASVQEFLRDPARGRPHHRLSPTCDNPDDKNLANNEVASLLNDSAGSVDGVCRDAECVDVVLSDMSAPWDQTSGFWKRSLSDPYSRMMNTSGMSFRDHAGSMV